MKRSVWDFGKSIYLLTLIALGCFTASACRAQTTATAAPSAATQDWQTAAGGKMEFDVASVRQNKTGEKPSLNVSPTSFDSFSPTGGIYSAKNIGLMSFIMFAYKLSMSQIVALESQLPSWAMTDQFDIEARAAGDPTKDQYRLMMQSLLADRFKLVAHYETQQVPKFGIVLAKPGVLGPKLRMHRVDDPVCTAPAANHPDEDAEGFLGLAADLVE
jgi:uncharacterized protein (TIGR03435 family)